MKQPTPYIPRYRLEPPKLLRVPSAWKGIESILHCLMADFRVRSRIAIEFGVEYGFSLAALSTYFDMVIGVDHFGGLGHEAESFYPEVRKNLEPFPNAFLMRMPWQEFIKDQEWSKNGDEADLIHVDVDHSYADTHECGEWAVQHAPVVLFHDTLSYADVMRACGDLAEKYKLNFYNFEESHGLGILSRRPL